MANFKHELNSKIMRLSVTLISFLLILGISACKRTNVQTKKEYAIIIHGGSGNFEADSLSNDKKTAYKDKLIEALTAGEETLINGGSAMDAVEITIRIMEDSPLFNAGKGAVFTHEGTNELDASIMNGADMNVGSVAGVKRIKNPISAARAVMEKSKHVMLSGNGADKFAAENGIDTVPESYFFTKERYESLQNFLKTEPKNKLGTVGCVAMDKSGNLAAGTSTGGMTNKMYGRIGDSPIAGCGSYANNNTCGISFTGHGEYIIRYTAAHDISALMEYKGLSLKEAMEIVILQKLKDNGGSAGAIGIDKYGNSEMVFNTTAMFRAYIDENGNKVAMIGK